MTEHPCFSCSLPDCDERADGCALRKAIRQYDNLQRRKLPIPEDVRRRYRIAWRELYQPAKLERIARDRAEKKQAIHG